MEFLNSPAHIRDMHIWLSTSEGDKTIIASLKKFSGSLEQYPERFHPQTKIKRAYVKAMEATAQVSYSSTNYGAKLRAHSQYSRIQGDSKYNVQIEGISTKISQNHLGKNDWTRQPGEIEGIAPQRCN
ncbi:hypothetical protein AVEN_95372-1 [Araneus ventricosus]|uniref:Uncharacterized protein n=1 Tax=Araneus ventricosus TaxID=182803 RepID=A0A4Y2CI96_ARAVE|nr:hypothetical protein AVEN_95372-1 [Araneus ventricosus]